MTCFFREEQGYVVDSTVSHVLHHVVKCTYDPMSDLKHVLGHRCLLNFVKDEQTTFQTTINTHMPISNILLKPTK